MLVLVVVVALEQGSRGRPARGGQPDDRGPDDRGPPPRALEGGRAREQRLRDVVGSESVWAALRDGPDARARARGARRRPSHPLPLPPREPSGDSGPVVAIAPRGARADDDDGGDLFCCFC